jgi:hypothetical protein
VDSKPLTGGAQVVLASSDRSIGYGPFAADDSSVYYYAARSNVGPIGIVKMSLASGTASTFTSGVSDNVLGVALDDTSLYWADEDGRVMRQTPK